MKKFRTYLIFALFLNILPANGAEWNKETNMGGQSATLASAFLLDSTIASKIIVYYTAINNYNGHYAWASEIIADNFSLF